MIKNQNILKYRSDIDALRFIAITLVFFFHLKISNFEGGFVGVDIFFVISGFLLTKILHSNDNKKIFLKFLFSRARRLLPVLFIVSFIVFLSSIFFFPNYLLDNNFSNFYSSILGYSNWTYLFNSQDYFRNSSELNPLLHTWSISIELQFYFFICLFFLLFLNFNKKTKLILIILITTISVLLNLDLHNQNSQYLYYFTPLRFSAFGIGCIAGFSTLTIKTKYKNLFSIFSLIIIFFSFPFIDQKDVPGYLTLIPCFGAYLFILSEGSISNNLIGNRLFSYLGKISYSTYLIHWPVIVFFSFFSTMDILIKIIIIFVVLIISIFSYHIIEIPLKINKKLFKLFILFFLIISLLPIFFSNYINDFIINNQPNKIEKIYISEKNKRQVLQSTIDDKRRQTNYNAKILIIGDSHSQDIYLGLINNKIEDSQINQIQFDTQCHHIKKSYFIDVYKNFFDQNSINECSFQRKKLNNFDISNIKTVIISNDWSIYPELIETGLARYFDKFLNKQIIVVRQNLSFSRFEEIFTMSEDINEINKKFYLNEKKEVFEINKKLSLLTRLNKKTFFDYVPDLCNHNSCEIFNIKENFLSHIDRSHYSLKYSNEIGILLKQLLN